MAAKVGDRVQVHYTGRVGDTVFDSSIGGDPIGFHVGANEIIAGFDEAVVGMEVGEKKTFYITPDQAFGEYDDNLVQSVPKEFFAGHPVQVGQFLQLQSRDGRVITTRVAEVTEETVTLDLNHPLAGKTLTFDIELMGVEPGRGSIIIP